MVGMKVPRCSDKFFGYILCTNQVAFTLTLVCIVDLVLFFLDTPWCEIYTRLPKRIYSKLLATSDLEIKYEPKVRVLPVARRCNH
jgi:1,3-beta-glucan synthase